MLSSRAFRIGLAAVGLIVLLGCAWAAWQAWQVNRDLTGAIDHAERFEQALGSGDDATADRELDALKEASTAAADRTSGVTWSVLGVLPLIGDDARGVRIASQVIADLSADGLEPFVQVNEDLKQIKPVDGTVPIDVIEGLRDPVAQARDAITDAEDKLAEENPAGFVGRLSTQYRELERKISNAAAAMRSAEVAVDVLPDMLGDSGPRDYLLLFQNNAEIRATGGMPGSWAQVHAEDGKVSMVQQGTATDFPHTEDPVVELTDAEMALYGEEIGTYFQDPGFAPDFPRAAQIWRAHWDRKFPSTPLDGVIALDPVAMSYLLEGTGPVQVRGTTLTQDNLVEELLNRPYLELNPAEQDALFQEAARAIFDVMTDDLASPVPFIEGLRQAADEGRLLVAPFESDDAERLSNTEVLGEFETEPSTHPLVDIGLNDATGSKMSYYLRYWAEVEATACNEGAQQLDGTITLSQTIAPGKAAALPESVTGPGRAGFEQGTQFVAVRIYGPSGGAIEGVKIDGEDVTFEQVEIEGRPAATLAVHLTTRDDAVISWRMRAGDGQDGDVHLRMTPGASPGDDEEIYQSAC